MTGAENWKLGHDWRLVRTHRRPDATRLRCRRIVQTRRNSSRLSPTSCEFNTNRLGHRVDACCQQQAGMSDESRRRCVIFNSPDLNPVAINLTDDLISRLVGAFSTNHLQARQLPVGQTQSWTINNKANTVRTSNTSSSSLSSSVRGQSHIMLWTHKVWAPRRQACWTWCAQNDPDVAEPAAKDINTHNSYHRQTNRQRERQRKTERQTNRDRETDRDSWFYQTHKRQWHLHFTLQWTTCITIYVVCQ